MRVESLIIVGIALLIASGPTLHERLGLRSLTFERTSDIVFGAGIVLMFLAAILFLGQN